MLLVLALIIVCEQIIKNIVTCNDFQSAVLLMFAFYDSLAVCLCFTLFDVVFCFLFFACFLGDFPRKKCTNSLKNIQNWMKLLNEFQLAECMIA